MSIAFESGTFDSHAIRMIYQLAAPAFRIIHGHAPRPAVERLLSDAWDRAECETEDDFNRFYRDSLLVTEEVSAWHSEKRGQRLRRVIHAAAIARELGLNRFAEVGAGIGTDGIALAKLGFDCAYLAEINIHSLLMMRRCAEVHGVKVPIVDLAALSKEQANELYGPIDWLYSSDVFEHIHDLECWLDGWIGDFKALILYAPFGVSDKNHAHTAYSKFEFNAFMATQGFTKQRVTGLGIPPMVYTKGLT